MPLPDLDDGCCEVRGRSTTNFIWDQVNSGTKLFDLTAKAPFETYEHYYPEYKRCFPGTIYVLLVIFATMVYAGLIYFLFLESESVTSVNYPEPIPTDEEFTLQSSMGVQIFPVNSTEDSTLSTISTGLFQSDLAWTSKVKVQWVKCTIANEEQPSCESLDWEVCNNGICPTSAPKIRNQLYSPSYTVVGFIIGHCASDDIPLLNSTGTFTTTSNCAYSDASVRAELDGAIVQVRTKNYLPTNIEESFLKDAYSQFRDLMDTSVIQLIDYMFEPYFVQPLTKDYFISISSIKGSGYAAVLEDRRITQTSSDAYIFGSGGSTFESTINLNQSSVYGFYQFGLNPVQQDFTVDEQSLLSLLALIGSWCVLVWLVSIVIRFITMRLFWQSRAEASLRRDKTTEQFLQAITNCPPQEIEDPLLYAVTFGGTKKFGWQIKHIFGYYQSNSFDEEYREKIMGPLTRFRANRRIEEGIKRNVGEIDGGDEKGLDFPRHSKNSKDKREAELAERMEQVADNDVRKEIFVSMALYHITTEMLKLREVIATEFNNEAKMYGLEEKLNDVE
mmetsp:Transcript_35240/g.56636  ORF Transcript_35240/g.56636 Transcript_35240/m.56636 type:complete len:560 (+) Transcript_35240:161-1840(+)